MNTCGQVRLEDCKRVVLFSYNKQLRQVEIRHYLITLKATGVSKSVKRVISAQIPDLSKFQDISDYVLKYSLIYPLILLIFVFFFWKKGELFFR